MMGGYPITVPNTLRQPGKRAATVTTTLDMSPNSIFSNAAAREYGFTNEFWYEAYELYEKGLANDPCKSLDVFAIERTIRLPLADQEIDVLVRSHSDAREFQ